MKKTKLIALSLASVMLLTGCGSKTLTCTKTEEEEGIKMQQSVKMTFAKENVSEIEMKVSAQAVDETIKSYWSMFTGIMDSTINTESSEGIKIESKNDDKNYVYTYTIKMDLAKVTAEDLENYDLEEIADSKKSYDEIKKAAEKDGFTCK